MAVFLCSHVTEVLVNGRALGTSTRICVRCWRPAGLLHSPGSAALIPYYFLAPIAFFAHFAYALKRRINFAGVLAAGTLISASILAALCGFRPFS